jgi:hypothetical protein
MQINISNTKGFFSRTLLLFVIVHLQTTTRLILIFSKTVSWMYTATRNLLPVMLGSGYHHTRTSLLRILITQQRESSGFSYEIMIGPRFWIKRHSAADYLVRNCYT